jgi:hypothetical protein
MVITSRTKLSLCQLLDLIFDSKLSVLLKKHNIFIESNFIDLREIESFLFEASKESIGSLIHEIFSTKGYLKKQVTTVYVFEERWKDFEKCLMLDGYKIEQSNVVRIEPLIESSEPIEDDLTKELQKTSLPSSDKIISLIKSSSEEFKKPIPDYYNGCLTSTRVALETLVKEIAVQKNFVLENDDKKVWGNSLRHLKATEFITENEEKAIASFYTFISKGAHRPLGFTDEEFVRFGINLAISACYFLVKILNGDEGS